MTYEILRGDCLAVLKTLPDSAFDSICTDPPYELGFMGKSWDASGIAYNVEVWREALRVLKPGGHLLAFSGSRTYHRMTCAIEDAGFEIRDQIMWLYGSGFPKSLDVSKAIDKRGGNSHMTAEIGAALKAARTKRGITMGAADAKYCGGVTLWSWYEGRPAGQQIPTPDVLARIALDWPEMAPYAAAIAEAEREVIGQDTKARSTSGNSALPTGGGETVYQTWDITAPATDAARQWEGWGTALKPAHEPICVARKPLVGTVAANVLQFGTGALNIDGCRVPGEPVPVMKATGGRKFEQTHTQPDRRKEQVGWSDAGRWPANLCHDGSDEVLALFPDAKGQQGTTAERQQGGVYGAVSAGKPGIEPRNEIETSAARFFYCAKASAKDRNSGLDRIVEVMVEWADTSTGDPKWGTEARQARLWVDTAQFPPKVIGAYGASSKSAIEWNTMLYGSEYMGLFLLDSTSTTLTETNCTTPSGILNFFQNCITNENTRAANCETVNGGNPAANAASCSTLIATTDEWMASALGAKPVASPLLLKLSASAARSRHPTVKPTALMQYLCRLVTPPGGHVLDPFAGSGSTIVAALREGFSATGIELLDEHADIADARAATEATGGLL